MKIGMAVCKQMNIFHFEHSINVLYWSKPENHGRFKLILIELNPTSPCVCYRMPASIWKRIWLSWWKSRRAWKDVSIVSHFKEPWYVNTSSPFRCLSLCRKLFSLSFIIVEWPFKFLVSETWGPFHKRFHAGVFQTLAWKPRRENATFLAWKRWRENANILDKKDPFIGV